ncbi:hypothetical protein ACEUAO_16660, partial [Aeromonas caviae]|uniref:hypothetical protein n=1 Tax=Aeromonas caviae TaxID=648 RepID=UPI0038D1D95D
RQYQYDARRQQGDGGGVFGDNQFTSTLSVNFHFPRIPRRTFLINNLHSTIAMRRVGDRPPDGGRTYHQNMSTL